MRKSYDFSKMKTRKNPYAKKLRKQMAESLGSDTIFKRSLKSYSYALKGIGNSFKGQVNIKIQLVIAIVAIATAFYFPLARTERVIIIFLSFFVLILEMLNTAVEKTIDLIAGKEIHAKYAAVKDIVAGSVLTAAILAVIVGIIIFLPHLRALFG